MSHLAKYEFTGQGCQEFKVEHNPNRTQLTAIKMGHLQTTITKLITWAQVHYPSSPPNNHHIAPLQAREMSNLH